jgi:NAD(P)-dependent dehydrogenase (short-subunit alcohol dehydrogenase family)
VSRNLLAGRTALVTGAGQGLGRAIALEYAAEGARAGLIDRAAAPLAEAGAAVAAAGAAPLTFTLDVTDYTALAEAVEAAARAWGHIDVLVNNAGIFRSGSVLDDTLEDWRAVQAVNLEAMYMCSKLVAPHMVRQGGGRIIHIASVAAFASRGNVGAYNATKAGVVGLTKSMAVELAPHQILVNAIAPGFLRTAQMRSGDTDLTATDDFVDTYIRRRRIPLGRAGEPDDVAGTAVFLASDYCRYMTGQVLLVDGGLMSTF